jgi:WD40-like Beta Propeller Repeat
VKRLPAERLGKGRLVDAKTHTAARGRGIPCRAAAASLLASLLLIASAAPSAPAAGCPNEAIREAQTSAAFPLGTTVLPDCLALEMISPPKKFVQDAFNPSFSLDGTRALFTSRAAVGGTTGQYNPFGDPYVASRGASGWTTAGTSAPASAEIVNGTGSKGGPYTFSPELDRWLILGATQSQSVVGVSQVFSGGLDGSFQPLSPLLVPIDDSGDFDLQFSVVNADSHGTSADLSTSVIGVQLPSTGYLLGDPRGSLDDFEAGGENNSYVVFRDSAGEPSVQLLARDKDGNVYGGRCGSRLGGAGGDLNQGAISPEGSRIYFSTRPNQPPGAPCGIASAVTAAGSNTLTSVVTAVGSGILAEGSAVVTGVNLNEAAFLVGQTVTGTGIPGGTTIIAVGPTSLELSQAATASGVQTISAGALPFSPGLPIKGAGIPGGTKITAVNGQTVTLSADATATAPKSSVVVLQPKRIFRRTQTPTGPEISEIAAGEPAAPGNDLFQGASLDGEKVYLATPRSLTGTDEDDPGAEECSGEPGKSAGCDLYLYDHAKPPGERLTLVSRGEDVSGEHEAGKGANVLSSIVALSGDGSYVYFAAQGVLTDDPNLEGETPVAGQPNLYLYRRDAQHSSGQLAFIGTLVADDWSVLWAGAGSFIAYVSTAPLLGAGKETGGDGHVLAFTSRAPLTGDDADDGRRDLFRYDAETETLERISKAAPGGSDNGPFDVTVNANTIVPGANFATQGRWVAEDGETIAFGTAEALAPGDEDGVANAFLWRAGDLIRVPAPTAFAGSEKIPTVSPDGETFGFSTAAALLPQDTDTAGDAYALRVGGGFPNPPPPTPCDPLSESSCQGPSSPPGSQPGVATRTFAGPGNPKPPKQCRGRQVRRRGKCVKPRAKKQQRKQRGRAARKQGGAR